jgi:membrane-associated protease RseP (regulator of RpoE activity)
VNTPGAVQVTKSKSGILIDCNKDGFQAVEVQERSNLDGWFFGNFAVGGIAGAGFLVDWADGASNKYRPIVNVELEQARAFGVGVSTLDRGVRVEIVQAGSAAASSGINVGDVLISLDGEPINAKGDVRRILSRRQAGAIVAVHLVRNGAPLDLAAQL